MRNPARRALVALAASAFYRAGLTGLLCRVAGHARRARRFPILSYHRVNDECDPYFPSLPTAVFEQQMAYVARAYRVLTLEELVDRLPRGDVPANALAITFDDGYRDNLTHAAPILARHGLVATIFLATGFIGTGEIPWFDRVAGAFKTAKPQSFRAPWGAMVRLGSNAERLAALQRTLTHLKGLPHDRLESSVAEIGEALGPAKSEPFKDLMLGWDDVHALRGLGCSIGAHTVSHPILSRMSPQRARNEIVGSRDAIEAACGTPPRAFAYPNGRPGDYTEATVHLVREAGFSCAVTTCFGLNDPTTSPWELRRGGPWEDHLPTFALKLAWYRLALGQGSCSGHMEETAR